MNYENLGKKIAHIDFKTYSAICRKNGVKEERSQILLSSYLHTIGSYITLC